MRNQDVTELGAVDLDKLSGYGKTATDAMPYSLSLSDCIQLLAHIQPRADRAVPAVKIAQVPFMAVWDVKFDASKVHALVNRAEESGCHAMWAVGEAMAAIAAVMHPLSQVEWSKRDLSTLQTDIPRRTPLNAWIVSGSRQRCVGALHTSPVLLQIFVGPTGFGKSTIMGRITRGVREAKSHSMLPEEYLEKLENLDGECTCVCT